MTVSVQTPFKSAVAAGSATFIYDFRTLDASYLVVKVNGVLKALTTDYTVTGVNAQGGGTVVFGVAPTVGSVVTIQRKTPFQRSTDYQTNGDFMATTVNPDFDALWMALQDTGFLSALAVMLPTGDTAAPMTLPDVPTRANKFLAFDALGNAMAAAGLASVPVSSFMTNVVAALTGAAALGLLGVQTQAATAFPTTGTAPAYVVTASPAVGLTVDTRLQLTFHASTSGACTLAANGTAATSIKQYDSTGAKIDPVIVANMKADVVYDGTHWVIVDPLPLVASAAQGAFKNLAGWADGISSLVGYSVDEIVAEAGAGSYVTGRNLNLSINLTSAGANGLDTGTVAANSWYSTWAIYNPSTLTWAGIAALCPVLTGNTTAASAVVTGLASTASMRAGMPLSGGSFPANTVVKSVDSGTQITASQKATSAGAGVSLAFVYDPVMPSGYTTKARVGMTRTDGTANKFPLGFIQAGRFIQPRVAAGSNVTGATILANGVLGNPSTPTWVAIGLTSIVPPTACAIELVLFSATSGAGQSLVAPNNSYGGWGSLTNPPPFSTNTNTTWGASFKARMLLESSNIYIAQSVANVLSCHGWEDNL